MPNFRQIQLLGFRQFLLQINRFRIFHGRLYTLDDFTKLSNPRGRRFIA
jgi:hypothetical protein